VVEGRGRGGSAETSAPPRQARWGPGSCPARTLPPFLLALSFLLPFLCFLCCLCVRLSSCPLRVLGAWVVQSRSGIEDGAEGDGVLARRGRPAHNGWRARCGPMGGARSLRALGARGSELLGGRLLRAACTVWVHGMIPDRVPTVKRGGKNRSSTVERRSSKVDLAS